MMDKYALQNRLYRYPYHYIPELHESGEVSRHQLLDWGFEYLCYMRHVRELVVGLRPSSLLDVGCGDGRLLHMLSAEAGTIRQVGVDTSSEAIALARALNDHAEFICGDVADVDGEFDTVTLVEVLEHIPESAMASFVASSISRLRTGGHLIVSVPSVAVPLNRKHYRHYDAGMVHDHIGLAEQRMTMVSLEYVFDRTDMRYRWWKRLTSNRRWFVAVPAIDRMVWRRVWHRMRAATPSTGAHIIAVFRRD